MYGSSLCEPDIIGPITTWTIKANGTSEQGREVVRRSTLSLSSEFCFEDKNKFQCMEVVCVNQTLLDQSQLGQ